jgi:hypothetical protein
MHDFKGHRLGCERTVNAIMRTLVFFQSLRPYNRITRNEQPIRTEAILANRQSLPACERIFDQREFVRAYVWSLIRYTHREGSSLASEFLI